MIPKQIRVEAVAELSGLPVGSAAAAPKCTTCGAQFFADASVTGYAYRFTDVPNLRLARLYCMDCNRETVQFPTLGAYEIQIESRLEKRLGSLLLDGISILDYAEPTESKYLP